MMVQALGNAGSTPSLQATPQVGSVAVADGLDRDAFLRLLVTQMRHQDPLSPIDDRQFMAELAQFAALERLEHLVRQTSVMQQMYATHLLGKTVTLVDGTQANVKAVRLQHGVAMLELSNGTSVALDHIASVVQAGTPA